MTRTGDFTANDAKSLRKNRVIDWYALTSLKDIITLQAKHKDNITVSDSYYGGFKAEEVAHFLETKGFIAHVRTEYVKAPEFTAARRVSTTIDIFW